MQAFIKALHSEIDLQCHHSVFENAEFSTLYFGGGTPSLLPPDDLFELMNHLQQAFSIQPQAQVSLEANPGTVLLQNLQNYVQAGVNRLTLGVQSFINSELSTLTRIHSSEEAIAAFCQARESGVEHIGLDLIFGIPGQILQTWEKSLQTALDLRPEHVSVYGLTYEPETALTRLAHAGQIIRIDEEIERDMFYLAKQKLEHAGYEQYEISNYALPQKRSLHNQKYWDFSPFLSLGPSAHSFDGTQRWWNVADLGEYVKRLNADQTPIQAGEQITKTSKLEEMILLGLRRREGIDLHVWKTTAGFDLLERAEHAMHIHGGIDNVPPFAPSEALITCSQNTLALTETGLILYDTVCQIFFDLIF